MRKLNPETRMCTSIMRFLSSTLVLYWSIRHHDISFKTLVAVFFKWNFLTEFRFIPNYFNFEKSIFRQIFILSFVVIILNFYLRTCLHFLAAMRVRMIPIAHPVLNAVPLLFFFFYSICHWLPICRINVLMHYFGLSLYCIKSINPAFMEYFSDFYVSSIWMLNFIIWNYYFIKGDCFGPMDEVYAF